MVGDSEEATRLATICFPGTSKLASEPDPSGRSTHADFVLTIFGCKILLQPQIASGKFAPGCLKARILFIPFPKQVANSVSLKFLFDWL